MFWSKRSIYVRSVLDLAEVKNWWETHRPTNRRLVQLYAALLYNANIKGFIDGKLYTGDVKAACVPGFNCYSCPGAIGACPLGSLQNALASSGHVAGWYVFGILLLFGIIGGRTICGWICPLGLIQELLHKIPVPKIRKSRITRVLSYLKYVVLAVFVIAIPLMYGLANNVPLPAFCKYICPAGTLEGATALLSNPNNDGMFAQLGILFTRKYVILIIIGLACIFCYRAFCRFLCPLGAIYSLFNRFCLIGVKVDKSRCNHCGACVRHCEMDVRHVNDHECISCGKCMSSCAQGAISIKCGSLTLKGPKTGKNADPEPVRAKRKRNGRIVWGIMLAVLVGALIYFNFIDVPQSASAQPSTQQEAQQASQQIEETLHVPDTEDEDGTDIEDTSEDITVSETDKEDRVEDTTVSGTDKEDRAEDITEQDTESGTDDSKADGTDDYTSTAAVGHEVGQQLEDFTCTLTDGSTFHLADHKGQIVIINQWATYCTPCVNELPYFEQLKEEHPEIEILAFHHWLESNPKAIPYIEEKGWDDWKIDFMIDTKELDLVGKIGGDNTMPRTLVLNKKGEVVYNEQRSVTPEMLEELLKQAED